MTGIRDIGRTKPQCLSPSRPRQPPYGQPAPIESLDRRFKRYKPHNKYHPRNAFSFAGYAGAARKGQKRPILGLPAPQQVHPPFREKTPHIMGRLSRSDQLELVDRKGIFPAVDSNW